MAANDLILGRYKILEAAGAGATGRVVHAKDTKLKRDVAIKIIHLPNRGQDDAKDAQGGEGERPGCETAPSRDFARGATQSREDAQSRRVLERGGEYFAQSANYTSASDDLDTPPWDDEECSNNSESPATLHSTSNVMQSNASSEAGDLCHFVPSATQSREDALSRRDLERGDEYFAQSTNYTSAACDVDASCACSSSPSPAQLAVSAALDEARKSAKLEAANIVTVYDFAVSGDAAYVIMEYVDGATLADVLAALGDDVTLDVVAAVVKGVARALSAAHKAGVLHLDIKPQNVLIDKSGQVKVADFGMSALMDAAGCGRAAGGTIGYMPPEQLGLGMLDVRTDEWALASITYEMLVGENPFKADTVDAAAHKIDGAELVLPSLCWDGMDTFADDVIFAALDPRPDARYDTPADFAAELAPMLGSVKAGAAALADAVQLANEQAAAAAVAAAAAGAGGGQGKACASGSVQKGGFLGLFRGRAGRGAGRGDAPVPPPSPSPKIVPGKQAFIDFSDDAGDWILDDEEEDAMPAQFDALEAAGDAANTQDARKGHTRALSPRAIAVVKRLICVAAVAYLAFNCLANVHIAGLLDTAPQIVTSAIGAGAGAGLFTDANILAWVILAAFALLAAISPATAAVVSVGCLAFVRAVGACFLDPIAWAGALTWVAFAAFFIKGVRLQAAVGKKTPGSIVCTTIAVFVAIVGFVVAPAVFSAQEVFENTTPADAIMMCVSATALFFCADAKSR